MEVICIDDCSTDDTLNYLRKEQKNHPNLVVLKTEKNLRQGGARNLGIRAAKGDYIMFLDQDDYYSNEALNKVLDHLNTADLDVLVCDSAWQVRGSEKYVLQHNLKFHHVMMGDDFIADNGIPFAPWKFVIKKSLFQDNNLYFQDNVRIEDVDWALKLVHSANRVQYQPILLVHYNRGVGSTTWDSYKNFDTIKDTIVMSKRVFLLTNTSFCNSEQRVKKVVESISVFYFSHGLRQFNGVYGFVNEKERVILDYILGNDINVTCPFIVRFAMKRPYLYALCSSLISPFYRCALWLYRSLKYKI